MALSLRLALLSFFFSALSIRVSCFPVDRQVHGQGRQVWSRPVPRNESNRHIPRAVYQITISQTAADPVVNSTTNSTTTVNSATTQPPTAILGTNGVGTSRLSGLQTTTTTPTVGDAVAVNPSITKAPTVSSMAAGISPSFHATTTVPIVTSTAITSSVIFTAPAASNVTSTSIVTIPVIAVTTAVSTQTTKKLTTTSAVSKTTAVQRSTVVGTPSIISTTTATSTATSILAGTSSVIRTTAAAPTVSPTSVSTSSTSSIISAPATTTSTSVGTSSVNLATTVAPIVTSASVVTSSVGFTTRAVPATTSSSLRTSSVVSTTTVVPTLASTSVDSSSLNHATTVAPIVASTSVFNSYDGSTTKAVPTTPSTSIGTSSVVPTTTVAPTLISTAVDTSSIIATTTAARTDTSTAVATSPVSSGTTAVQALSSTSTGTSSVTTTIVPTVTSTTAATSSAISTTTTVHTVEPAEVGTTSVISTTTAVPTTIPTSVSSSSIILSTTALPTVTSTSFGTAPINNTTTVAPTVTSASVRPSSVIFSTSAAPTASPATTGTSSVLVTTTAVHTIGSRFVISTTTVVPTSTSASVGTSFAIPTTTAVPTVTSTSAGSAPTISATTAIPRAISASASTAPVTTTTAVAPNVTSTSSGISSVISTTAAAPIASSTTTGTSSVTSVTTTASTTTPAVIGNASVIPTTTTVPTVTPAATGTSSVASTTTTPAVSPTTVASSTAPSTSTSPPVTNSKSPANTTIASPCPTTGASASMFRMNVGGAAITDAAMGAENENYTDTQQRSGVSMSDAASITATDGPAPWDEAYRTYRWIAGTVLRYRIPVKRGNYTVKLLFAENVHSAPNARQFDVFINGAKREQALDVYATVGKNVGLLKKYTNVTTAAFVEIALIKVVDHPMLSGIVVEGPGAGAEAVGGGCASNVDAELEFNNGFDHRAHAVPNGPYNATDFDKVGSALVSLDGTLSHSHYSDPGPPEVSGHIVSYRWTWTEIVNGTEVMRENKDKSGKFQERFSVGKTLVTLEVVDNTGDSASDYAEVDVRSPTKQGVYCYGYSLGNASVPSVLNSSSLEFLKERKPQYGGKKAQILFSSVSDFGESTLFEGSFMYRCTFFLSGSGIEGKNISLNHNGPFVLYQSGAVAARSDDSGETELHFNVKDSEAFEILYSRDARVSPTFEFKADGAPIAAEHFAHDESDVLPVISRLSETGSAPSGGGNIRVFGSGFFSNVKIFFGENEAQNVLKVSSKLLQVRIPSGEEGEVMVTVQSKVAISNGIKFLYADPINSLVQPVIFETKHLQHHRLPNRQHLPFVAAITYGPDFRLYLGSFSNGHIHAIAVGDGYKVRGICKHSIGDGRSVLGLAFSPFTNRLRLYFSSSLLFWKKSLSFEEGWVNGKIETIDFSHRHRVSGHKATGECAFNQTEVVTGLPVSAHDHAVNKLEFMPDGRLLITIGGFTNGGISVPGRKRVPGDPPDDTFGGVASNPLSAAVVSCPVHTVTRITYDNYTHPEKAKIVDGKDCFVYASGIRNSFGMTLHTNGHLYVTDNGGSRGNGDFSTDCHGGSIPATKQRDKLFRLQRGGYHGHPNLNRGECVHYPPDAVQPILGDIESSTDGVVEYRSNVFGGKLKGDLLLTKFASNNRDGRISQVILDDDGGVAPRGFIENLYGRSGLSVVEGPRGELVMPQVYQKGVLFVYPKIKTPKVTFVIGVLPKKGPARGGAKVIVSGFGFSQNSTVWFGNAACRNVRVFSQRKLVCWTPPGQNNELVSVVVDGLTGRSPTYGSDYWYF